ncbi:regulatory inactivation of DnaA Hda protein [Rhodoferax sp. OV413]|uniref:DnaA regulatory inactivator Hda n=1 Tax=Rhodoferax sp. OV413 TaxID=1855285 RepID=UPI00088A8181|nr:DnaA regulatory inactivator Hda [Rhodoferax sp. OV413]SDO25880.1 regulatory inactivation of DnaA Hda protein [Rhodoferax sp. OV413]
MQQLVLDIGLATSPTLANFFAGQNAAALQHVQQSVVDTGRPLQTYLWGGSATGKTYLLRAVREAYRMQAARVGWLDPSVYEPPEFDDGWAAVLLDDVHLYNPAQQHMAFKWFVNAQTSRCWVLGAGDVPPADLVLREDLRTRLGGGHIFALQALSEDECRGVLRREAQARGLVLSGEVVDFMLRRFSRDLGSLMQLLEHLDRYALQTQRAITIPLVKSMLETI